MPLFEQDKYRVDRKALGRERGEGPQDRIQTLFAMSTVALYVGKLTKRLLVPSTVHLLM